MAIKVAFLGLGKMGRAAARKVIADGGFEVVAGFDSTCVGSDIGVLSGLDSISVKVEDPSQLASVLARTKPDVVVDFSSAKACLENAKAVAQAKAAMIVGTTGFSQAELENLKKTLSPVGAIISPNMSVGVNVFFKLVGQAAAMLKGYDIEVVEAHHNQKKDAPSGTAMRAVKVVADAIGADMGKDVVYGRSGMSKRKEGEIGVHSIRAGDIVGEHTVMFTTEGERFEVRHVAHSRESFASGIPQAIRFIKGRKGVFGMEDVLGLK